MSNIVTLELTDRGGNSLTLAFNPDIPIIFRPQNMTLPLLQETRNAAAARLCDYAEKKGVKSPTKGYAPLFLKEEFGRVKAEVPARNRNEERMLAEHPKGYSHEGTCIFLPNIVVVDEKTGKTLRTESGRGIEVLQKPAEIAAAINKTGVTSLHDPEETRALFQGYADNFFKEFEEKTRLAIDALAAAPNQP